MMGKTITLTAADGNSFSAYRADPEERTASAGVVVVQEVFGVNDHIRSVADSYAAEGYLAIAPALFDRVRPGVELAYDADGMDVGVDLAFNRLAMDDVMIDVSAAVQAAGEAVAQVGGHGGEGASKVGIVGYCWGGSISYVAAARLADQISAASGYYGGQIMPHIDEQPMVPLMLHFGSEDHGIPLDDVRSIDARWPDVDVYVYEGAGHGFNCGARDGFHEPSAALARQRTLAHFAAHL